MVGAGARARTLATLLLLAALVLPAISVQRAAAHDFAATECSACHTGDAPGAGGVGTATTGRIYAQCVKCHSACDVWTMHGPELEGPSRTAAGLPLDDSGSIDCRTCHRPHAAPVAASGEPGLLRIPNTSRRLCLACHPQRLPGKLTVIAPPPGVTVPGPDVLLAGTAALEPAAELFVRLNDAAYPLPLKAGSFSTWLTLREGVNEVAILVDDTVRWQTQIFRPDAIAGRMTIYRRLHLGHLTARGECADCHGSAAEGYGGIASPTASALCYRCHERFEGKRYLHGPVAVGACLSCHDPHGGIGVAALRDEQGALCLSCHTRGDVSHCLADERDGEPTCTACHDPHESDTKFFQRDGRR